MRNATPLVALAVVLGGSAPATDATRASAPLTTADERAIRAFWWPADGSHTKILTFVRQLDELDGRGDVAWTRGTDRLTFTYSKGTAVAAPVGSRSMTLAVLRLQPSGEWRIGRMMWGTRKYPIVHATSPHSPLGAPARTRHSYACTERPRTTHWAPTRWPWLNADNRPMRGYIYVAPKGVPTAAALRSRLKPAIAFVGTLPKK